MGNSRHIPEYQRLSGSYGHAASILPQFTGFCFQIKVLMILLYRAYINNFNNCLYRVGFEVKQLHDVELNKLDDVVIEYNENDGTVYRLIQVKHSTKQSKQIGISNLFTNITDNVGQLKLQIAAFFTEYQALSKKTLSKNISIKDVIIYTNMNFNDSDLRKNSIGIGEINEQDILFRRRNNGQRFRFEYTKELVERLEPDIRNYCKNKGKEMNLSDLDDSDIRDFVENRLTFAVNQPNDTELGSIIKREIAGRYGVERSDTIYRTFNDEIQKWISGDESAVKTEKRNFFSGEEVKKFFENIIDPSLQQSKPAITCKGKSC